MTNGFSSILKANNEYYVNDPNITDEFDATKPYFTGQYVNYHGLLYRFVSDHDAGAWDDSQVTVAKIGNEATILNDAFVTRADSSLWEAGAISSSGGGESSSTTRLRTVNRLTSDISKISVVPGYKYIVAAYDGTTYIGMWNRTTFAKSATWLTEETYLTPHKQYTFRIVLAKNDDSTITTTDGVNLLFMSTTDISLSNEGKIADAQKTGRLITGLANWLSFHWLPNEIALQFQEGERAVAANSSSNIVSSNVLSCSDLIPVSVNEIYTIINLMPDKYRFVVGAYTDNEANNGVGIQGGARVLNADLTESSGYSTSYSNTLSAVYKNTVEIIKVRASTKYLSIGVRRLSGSRMPEDVDELQNVFLMSKHTG